MITLKPNSDPHSLDIVSNDNTIGVLIFHNNTVPRVVLHDAMQSLTIEDMKLIIKTHTELTSRSGKLVPSMFMKHPIDSVFQQSEHETVALNIIRILAKTGDTFRPMSFEEYEHHRKSTSTYNGKEEEYFHAVVDFCTSAKLIRKFSPVWADIWESNVQQQLA